MEYLIRNSTKNDVYDLIHVFTVCWNETYKNLVPDDELEKMKTNEDERARKSLEGYDERDFTELVLEVDKKIVGVVRYGKSHDEEYDNCGEIFAIYLIKKYHGLGLGKKLFEVARDALKEMGFDKMIIACLKGNPTNSFYKHMGGTYVKDGLFVRLNLPENIYYYDI